MYTVQYIKLHVQYIKDFLMGRRQEKEYLKLHFCRIVN